MRRRRRGRVIAIDGKTWRNRFDEATGKSPLHSVSAWSTEDHLVLAQVATGEKKHLITAIPKLLGLLDLNGATMAIDLSPSPSEGVLRLGCPQEIAQTIIEYGGEYVLTLKGD